MDERWPALPAFDDWREPHDTLHMWLQIIGKIRLECGPWVNHSWGSTLYLTSRGLTTSPMPYQGRNFSVDFEFLAHRLEVTTAGSQQASFTLQPMTVQRFYELRK